MALEQILQPTTALEAINDMLASIGQGAVNSLENNESVDAASAVSILVNASRELQERGWFFNTDFTYPLTADSNGEIKLPPGALQFEPDTQWRGRIVERSRKLYDRATHSFIHAQGTIITGRVVWLLNFEDLPQAARTYIHRSAGRVFQESAVGSDLIYRFTKEREDEALAALTRAQLRADRPNAINDNAGVLYTAGGGRRRISGGATGFAAGGSAGGFMPIPPVPPTTPGGNPSSSDLVNFADLSAPAYLKTVSDLLNGEPVSVLRNINKSRWAGIKARTDTDDCALAILDLMNGAYNNKQAILRVPAGTYTIHRPIESVGGNPFRLIGDDHLRSIIVRGSDWASSVGTGSMFNISAVDNHSIENLKLNANNALYPLNGNHAIAVSNSNHCRYRNLYIEDWKNSGILVFHYPGLPVPPSAQEQNNIIENCYLDGKSNANNGILLVDQYYSHIRGCTVRDIGKDGTPQDAVQLKNRCYRSSISNCVAINARGGVAMGAQDVPAGEFAAEQCSVSDVIVRDCVWGVYMGQSAYCSLDNINIDQAGQGSNAIELVDCVENSLTNIRVREQLVGSGGYSVYFNGGSDRNYVQFAHLEIPDAIPEIAHFSSGASANTVRVGQLVNSSPILYSGQCKLDERTSPANNSFTIDGYEPQETKTIAAGVMLVMDPATKLVRVDTEASAVTDDLVTITGNGRDGQTIVLKTVANSRDVVVKHGTGNIVTKSGADVTLSAISSRIRLQYDSGLAQWVET